MGKGKRLPIERVDPRRPLPGFTLVELLVVVTLVTLLVGTLTLRLDAVSTNGRLRSAAMQWSARLRLAQSEANLSGTPRLVEVGGNPCSVTIRRPQPRGGTWVWDEGVAWDLGRGVRAKGLFLDGDARAQLNEDRWRVTMGAGGRLPPSALIVTTGSSAAVVLADARTEASVVLLDHVPAASTYADLLNHLESTDATSARTDAH